MKVLLVEDDDRVSRFIARGLTEDGHAVTVRADGRDAEDQLRYDPFDVVVLDLMLPGQSGMELLRHIRAGGIDTPVLVLTARDTVEDKVRGFQSGADDYLVKPFAFDELLARLRNLVRRSGSSARSPLRCGPLEVDPHRREARCNGSALELTRREFALIEYLCRNAGRVLSRAQIEQSVWGDEFDRETNVVAVYVSYLRRKLEAAGARGLLETVRGSGYRLREMDE
jgi:two-component system, OmpR family, copper resistance phosphate regulon response regulator CusR